MPPWLPTTPPSTWASSGLGIRRPVATSGCRCLRQASATTTLSFATRQEILREATGVARASCIAGPRLLVAAGGPGSHVREKSNVSATVARLGDLTVVLIPRPSSWWRLEPLIQQAIDQPRLQRSPASEPQGADWQ